MGHLELERSWVALGALRAPEGLSPRHFFLSSSHSLQGWVGSLSRGALGL